MGEKVIVVLDRAEAEATRLIERGSPVEDTWTRETHEVWELATDKLRAALDQGGDRAGVSSHTSGGDADTREDSERDGDAAASGASPVPDATSPPVDGDLIEATAAAVRKAIWEHSGEDGEFHVFLARAAVEVVLDRIEEEIGKLVHEPNRDENADQSYGYGLGLQAALAALGSLGKEVRP